MNCDVISFNGEYDLLEIRLNILDEYVDQFIICEAQTTFSGKPKPLYYELQKERYSKWKDKILYHVIRPEDEEKYLPLALSSPNTRGAEHWKKEFCQKEAIKDALRHLKDNDRVFIGDCDEIWEPQQGSPGIAKLKLRVYTYYINNRSTEEFWGPITGKWKDIKNKCLNHVRSGTPRKTQEYKGWHFTSLKDGLERKLTDSYTKESYATDQVMSNLEENVKNNKDFLGRDFQYTTDESELPKYLVENRGKYKHLFK